MGRCAEALYEVAQCYLTDEGTNYDPKESIYWMHQAADQGISQAQYIVSHQQTPYCPHEILSAPLRGIKSIAYDIHDN